jgi:hypothetical protein
VIIAGTSPPIWIDFGKDEAGMKHKAFGIALCLLSGLAFAGERWECTEMISSEVLVVAIVHDTKTTGQIEVTGTSQKADYEVKGFDRAWSFGGADADSFDHLRNLFNDLVNR